MTIAAPHMHQIHSLFSPALKMIQDGRIGAAIAQLHTLETTHQSDALILQHVGEYLMFTHQNADAIRVYRRAATLRPQDPGALYNLATAVIAMGDTGEAECLLDQVIGLDARDYDAYQNRATLRRQSRDKNHVAELEALFPQANKGRVALGYALAKELEDLGEWQRSFTYLKLAADQRRRGLSYDVMTDIHAMQEIARTFDADYLADSRSGFDSSAPVFVMGLPRSGTTLLDRIISSHSSTQSLGEINDFALCMTRLAKVTEAGKSGLIQAARHIDPTQLGEAYIASTSGYGVSAPRFIDKTPANYLYIGLILKALPNARIVHVRRDPVDNGYALYKTLFRMGCPYSYDLSDIGRYMLAHAALMAHWRTIAPERIIDISYEDLVENTEDETRRLINALDLDWQDACLNFHENTSAAATASAAQVRQPVYKTSVGLWRRYEKELAPLIDILREGRRI